MGLRCFQGLGRLQHGFSAFHSLAVAALLVVLGLLPLADSTAEELPKVLALLNSDYKHFTYEFERNLRQRYWHGEGALWLFFQKQAPPEPEPKVALRFEGLTKTNRLGNVKITTIIDAAQEVMHVNVALPDQGGRSECVTYPFQSLPAPTPERMAAFHAKIALRAKALPKLVVAEAKDPDAGPVTVPWSKHKQLQFDFSKEGKLLDVIMWHDGVEIKRLSVDGPLEVNDDGPSDAKTLFGPPAANCKQAGSDADPLATIQVQAPNKRSSALSDLLQLVSLDTLGVDQLKPLISMTAFALPGDIAVMIDQPDPPDLSKLGGLAFDYAATVFKDDMIHQSKGSVWADLQERERAFHLAGETPESKFGPVTVSFIARRDHVFANVNIALRQEHQCIEYQYPRKPGDSQASMLASSRQGLEFISVDDFHGDDCGVFAALLPRGRMVMLWVDLEKDDHTAILRADIRNNSQVLRTIEIMGWRNTWDEQLDLRPPQTWNCTNDSSPNQYAFFGVHHVQSRSKQVLDTLWAMETMPKSFAVLELLAMPGDVSVAVDEPSSIARPVSGEVLNLLNAAYKHISYDFDRTWRGKGWHGEGELWLWFQSHKAEGGVKLRFKGQTQDSKFGIVDITTVIDSEAKLLYTNFDMWDSSDSQCVIYPFPEKQSKRVDHLMKWMAQDVDDLKELQNTKGSGHLFEVPWTQKKKLDLRYGASGNFESIEMMHNGRLIKEVTVHTPIEMSNDPPPDALTIFGPPGRNCRLASDIMDPLARLQVTPAHSKSSALSDLLALVTIDTHRHMRKLLSLCAFALPGDMTIMIEEPEPPDLSGLSGAAFDYNAEVFKGGTSHTSSGSLWMNFTDRAFRLVGEAPATIFGPVILDFVARADEQPAVYASVDLGEEREHQCVAYKYPKEPHDGGLNSLYTSSMAARAMRFVGVGEARGEDCGIFETMLPRDRVLRLWVDMEMPGHLGILRSEVRNSSEILRILEITNWHESEDFKMSLRPQKAWNCHAKLGAQQWAHFGLHHVQDKSRELVDALYAMEKMDTEFAALEMLAVPGDVSMLIRDPESLQPAAPATLPPAVTPSTTKESPWQPTAGKAPNSAPARPVETYHNEFLMSMSLILALVTLVSIVVLSVIAGAAASGLSVPLLAALPCSSSALFGLQLIVLAGHGEAAPRPLEDLSSFLGWLLPSAPQTGLIFSVLSMALVWIGRKLALRRHQSENSNSAASSITGAQSPPHGLLYGAWELRALGVVAFPLSFSAMGVLVELTDSGLPFMGLLIAFLVLGALGHSAISALRFVTDMIEDKLVVRTCLPRTAGGAEVFVDRVCNQLRALPSRPAQPSCSVLFGGWLATPAWCVAPTVAAIHEVENRDLPAGRDEDVEERGGAGMWCSMEEAAKSVKQEHEDELQSRPLMASSSFRESADEHSEAAGSAGASEGAARSSNASAGSSGPLPSAWERPSAVALAHPVRANTSSTYEVRAQNLVAGVTCIPWLDCAVPAGALRRLEELCGDVSFRAHPSQLSGPYASGRYAACFDWGTHWPWRWPLETALKIAMGIWMGARMDPAGDHAAFAMLFNLAMLALVGVFVYGTVKIQPYGYKYDNGALTYCWAAAWSVVLAQAFDVLLPDLTELVAVIIALLVLVTCLLTLLSAMALASVMLGRLEVQGLQDRLLPSTIDGWGPLSFSGSSFDPVLLSGFSSNPGGCGMPPDSHLVPSNKAVDVILPWAGSGPRPALSILLPAMARPNIAHVQLLPPVAGRSGSDLESLPPSSTAGDRARLPLPPNLLFPSSSGKGSIRSEAHLSAAIPPIAALWAPGRPGRLVYEEKSRNEGKVVWPEAVRSFFGSNGEQLAEEAQKLIEAHRKSENGADSENAIVAVEVLPIYAVEFMDERDDPESARARQ